MATISRRKLARHSADRLVSGESTSDVLRELAAYLIQSRRLKEVDLIVRDIEVQLLHSGYVAATVVSARSLEAEAKKMIEQLIKDTYPAVKSIELNEEIDSSLIGGYKLTLPGAQADASVRTTLETMRIN